MENLLETIAELSHEFGTDLYVRGGGGNTSAKDAETLWVKPSGTTLSTIRPADFLPMDRGKLRKIHQAVPPADPAVREAMVKDLMLAAVRDGAAGRPSVEAPLHDSFAARFVVHTHPALVNGLTCSRDGRNACRRLFPDALWLDFVDPGFLLSRAVRQQIQTYRADRGREPEAVFLQNHGLFVAGDTPDDIRRVYQTILAALRAEYERAGVPTNLPDSPPPADNDETVRRVFSLLKRSLGEEAAFVVAAGPAVLPEGPLTPDHIVYAKSFAFLGEPTEETLRTFQAKHGYPPRVVGTPKGVFGLGNREKIARLALEFALDGALVRQLTAAFGGTRYMDDRAREFIEHWEVESYRQKQI